MQDVEIFLPTPEDVQDFVAAITALDGNFDLVSGNYILDAKSLMGIFTFDLAKPLLLKVSNPSPANMAAIQPFIYNQH